MFERLNNWCEPNKITIKVKKSKTLILGNRKTEMGTTAAALRSQLLERFKTTDTLELS